MEGWSESVVTREMQINPHRVRVFLRTIGALKKIANLGKDMERLELTHSWWECKTATVLRGCCCRIFAEFFVLCHEVCKVSLLTYI